mmetsp:Transcript_28993/g.60638  ORF Transcript_28993/g.60638 Transcript_28993/m.60638 type:complete len:208 (-) Transcript_28993:141-764(-)
MQLKCIRRRFSMMLLVEILGQLQISIRMDPKDHKKRSECKKKRDWEGNAVFQPSLPLWVVENFFASYLIRDVLSMKLWTSYFLLLVVHGAPLIRQEVRSLFPVDQNHKGPYHDEDSEIWSKSCIPVSCRHLCDKDNQSGHCQEHQMHRSMLKPCKIKGDLLTEILFNRRERLIKGPNKESFEEGWDLIVELTFLICCSFLCWLLIIC